VRWNRRRWSFGRRRMVGRETVAVFSEQVLDVLTTEQPFQDRTLLPFLLTHCSVELRDQVCVVEAFRQPRKEEALLAAQAISIFHNETGEPRPPQRATQSRTVFS
jgi:hypothetical protein